MFRFFNKMGSNPLVKRKIKVEELSEIERFLYESYRKIDVDFTFNEVTTLKLKLTDDKFYFHTEFSFLLFFNNSIFTENINQIYKNFNTKIESFINSSTTSDKKLFNVLIIVDDEIESLKSGSKIDFDGLFTIAFEKMEIFIMLYIDVTNCHIEYVNEFMKQLCENSILYRSGRKFDCIYLLLPNTDYIVKNSQTVSFITTRNDYNLGVNESSSLYELLNFDSFTNFLKCKYPPTSSNNQFSKFIKKVKPRSTSTAIYIDFNLEITDFPNENLYQFISIEILTSESTENIFYIYINSDFKYNPNFDLFINKILSSFELAMEKFKEKGIFLKIKLLLVNSNESKRNNRFLGNNLFSFSNNTNNINKSNNTGNSFKLKEVEMKVHELVCQKLKKKNKYFSNNTKLIFEFNEIIDDANKKELKKNKYRKTVLNYKFSKEGMNSDYLNLIFALSKKNYLNKMFDSENIKTNKINIKLLQFFGIKQSDNIKKEKKLTEDINIINNEKNINLKEKYDNGLEVEIVSEENEELVKLFETQFLKSV